MYDIPAVIFAGGKSARMGRDKALLPFEDFNSLSEFQHHKLSLLFKEVYLSSKKDKFDFACEVITDIYEESSPLVGIISVFEKLDKDEVFILSVDAPLVDIKVIEKLIEASSDVQADAIIAQSPDGLQPLCGIYRRTILPLAKKQLEGNNHKLKDLLQRARLMKVNFESHKPFCNVNTPEEYQNLFLR